MAKINHMISTSKAKSSLYFTSHLSFWVDHFRSFACSNSWNSTNLLEISDGKENGEKDVECRYKRETVPT